MEAIIRVIPSEARNLQRVVGGHWRIETPRSARGDIKLGFFNTPHIMRAHRASALLLRLLSVPIIGFAFAGCGGDSAMSLETTMAHVLSTAGPSIVHIRAAYVRANGERETREGMGVILEDGDLLTLGSLVDCTHGVTILFQDGRQLTQDEFGFVRTDPTTNLSLVRLGTPTPAGGVAISDVSESPVGRLGFGLFNTYYSKGLLADFGVLGQSQIGVYDAPNEALWTVESTRRHWIPGTPLFDRDGSLLGLVEGVIADADDVALIVPAATCRRVAEMLMSSDAPPRGWLGIVPSVSDDTAATPDESGVTVAELFGQAAARAAGLQAGDHITSFDDHPVLISCELRRLVASYAPGRTVTVEWRRGDTLLSAPVTLGAIPVDLPDDQRCRQRPL